MIGTNKLLAVGAVVAALLLPVQAMAAFEAHTRVDLNLRVGPATTYGVIDVIPAGYPVTVIGCLDEFNWCDVDWDGLRGWVSASYLVRPGTSVYLPQWAPQVGLPIVSFSFDLYHDRHYRSRPWHRQRAGRWQGRQEVRRPQQRTEQPRQRQRTQRPRQRQQAEQPRQRQRTQQPRQRQQAEQPQQRQRSQQPQQRQRTEQQQRQRSGTVIEQQLDPGTPRHGRASGN